MRDPKMPSIPQTEGWLSRVEGRELIARDGVRLFYEVVGQGDKTIVLANGLGGRLYSWQPLIEAFASSYRIVIWDYRGIFESHASARIHRLAIPEHAEDICEILDKEGISSATFVGWSMGVQVSLETAALYPDRVDRLVLLNGTYGMVFQTGFQPLIRIPWMSKVLHELLDYFRGRPELVEQIGDRMMKSEKILRKLGRLWSKLYGTDRGEEFLWQYTSDVFATDFGNYLRLFQELDAHSVYHLLREIEQPTLIISGLLDLLTPAYQSREMARKLPNAQHISIPLGTHFVLIEFPLRVVAMISTFFREHP